MSALSLPKSLLSSCCADFDDMSDLILLIAVPYLSQLAQGIISNTFPAFPKD